MRQRCGRPPGGQYAVRQQQDRQLHHDGLQPGRSRKTRIFGTRGELYGNGVIIEHFDFLTDQKQYIETVQLDSSILGGHGGGDYGLMDRFVSAVFGPNGEIVLDYAVYDALRAGFNKVVFVIRQEIEEIFREKIGEKIERQLPTVYVYQDLRDVPQGFSVPPERTKPWGTGHAVLAAREAVNTAFAVINADDYYGPQAFQEMAGYLKQARDIEGTYDYAMAGFYSKKYAIRAWECCARYLPGHSRGLPGRHPGTDANTANRWTNPVHRKWLGLGPASSRKSGLDELSWVHPQLFCRVGAAVPHLPCAEC
jgi:hypothetical protein